MDLKVYALFLCLFILTLLSFQVVFMNKHHLFKGIITHRFPRDRDTKIFFQNNRVRLEFNKLLQHQCALCLTRNSEGTFKMLQDHMRKDHELFYCELCLEHLKVTICFYKNDQVTTGTNWVYHALDSFLNFPFPNSSPSWTWSSISYLWLLYTSSLWTVDLVYCPLTGIIIIWDAT